eukprot:CAMPEP_0181346982 /NCGR_PEP_ID=MMETSP1101-20121128/33631_1 /TAXON_ID=46948 /ORGANISM="Rhodomonas abbreviata, Strain Caron Lab Isolate" /LENGTH=353 /DNA_ID=CAMNT_0023459157 /DNA_START=82 /DNA_END=1143 /DNA_ORIENTATION=+
MILAAASVVYLASPAAAFLAPSPLAGINARSPLMHASHRRTSPALGLKMGMRDQFGEAKGQLKSKAKKAGIATLAAIGMLLGAPGEGGPAPSAPASTAATQTRGATAVAAPAAAAPSVVVVHHQHHSPFGGFGGGMFAGMSAFSPFGYSPFGYSPFGMGFRPMFGVPVTAVLAVAGAAVVGVAGYSIYRKIDDKRMGIYSGISVAKLQVAVYCDSRESDWLSASVETKLTKDADQAEEFFGQMSLAERSKVERETVNRVNGMDRAEDRQAENSLESIGKPTVAVVTVLVALEGRKFPEVTDVKTLREALSQLGSDVIESDGLLAGEIMWTPEEAWETILPDDLPLSYPKLMPL